MQDARDDGGRGVQELEMGFEDGEMGIRGRDGGPEERVVIGEQREEDAEEEGSRCIAEI